MNISISIFQEIFGSTDKIFISGGGLSIRQQRVKSAQIRSYFWSDFPIFGLNTEICGVNLRIQFEYKKMRTRNNSVFRHFLPSAIILWSFEIFLKFPNFQRSLVLRCSATCEELRIYQFITKLRFTSGERKICSTIEKSENIINMNVCKIFFCFLCLY